MKKNLFALLIVLLASGKPALSQKNTYSFSKTTGNTYTELTGDIMVPGFNAAGLYNIPGLTGDTLKFYGKPFKIGGLKTIAIGEGPFLRIDDDSSAVIIDVAFTTIDTIDATTRISYRIDGTPGNKIIKLQYRNFKLHTGPFGNSIHVQIWYHQQSGVVELRYGPRSSNNASGYTIQTGPNIGMFYAPDTFTSCYQKLWCHGSPTSVALDSAATLSFKAMSGVPDEGTIFKFTPRSKPLPPPPPPPTNTLDVSLGETSKVLNIRVQPNPASDKILIEGHTIGNNIMLYDVNGKLLNVSTGLSERCEIDIHDLSPGIYILKVVNKDGAVLTKKWIKEP